MTAVFRLCRIGCDEDQAGGLAGQRAGDADSLAAPAGWALFVALLLLLEFDIEKKDYPTFVRFCLHCAQPWRLFLWKRRWAMGCSMLS